MIDSYTKTPRPIRDVDIEYSIDQSKCDICEEKPCLASCPIEAIYIDSIDGKTKINSTCFGCVLCRNACPYDAITINKVMAPPIQENVPNINSKLCKACGACVQACKTGAININAIGSGEAHSEIDPDKCIRCGYCFRVCPTDAIKYGELIPKTVKGGKAIVIRDNNCIGCMTCTRVCPSMGAIEVSKTSRLPYINPSYCARCEECMHSCPSGAIKYSSRKRAFSTYTDIKYFDIVSEIVNKDMKKLTMNIIGFNEVLLNIAKNLILKFDDEPAEEYREIEVGNSFMEKELGLVLDKSITVDKVGNVLDTKLIDRNIKVLDSNCIGCGECLNVCPVNAIRLNPPNPIEIQNNCVFCGLCADMCKFSSIKVYDDYYFRRDDKLFFARLYVDGERKGNFSLFNKDCQVCTICVKNCPTEALSCENDEILFEEDKCIYCRECEQICPVDAIAIKFDNDIEE